MQVRSLPDIVTEPDPVLSVHWLLEAVPATPGVIHGKHPMNTTSPQGVDGLIARQQQSGKTVKAFCEENGGCGPSFYAWRKRLKGKIQPVGLCLGGEHLQIGSRAQRRAP